MNCYIELHPIKDSDHLLMISNEADCISVAIDVAKSFDSVEWVEIQEPVAAPQMAPSGKNDPQRDHGPYKYVIALKKGLPSYDAIINQLVDAMRQTLKEQDINATVSA